MAVRGTKPKPHALRVLTGTRRPGPKPAPVAGTFDARPPAELDAIGRAEWRRAVAASPAGLLTTLDRAMVVAYCQSYSRARRAEAVLHEKGFTLTTPQGFEQARPEVSIARNSWEAMRKFATECGFSPSARTRVAVPERSSEENPFAALVSN